MDNQAIRVDRCGEKNGLAGIFDRFVEGLPRVAGESSCPMQAGNRLHHFFNSILWSVVTNRTLLWKYYDQKTCKTIGQNIYPTVCSAANTVEDCNQVLKRSSWIPSYDHWIGKTSSPRKRRIFEDPREWQQRHQWPMQWHVLVVANQPKNGLPKLLN